MKIIKRIIRAILGPVKRKLTNEEISSVTTLCGGLKAKYPTIKTMDHLIFRAVTVETYIRFPFIKKVTSSWVIHSMAVFEDADITRTTRAYVELPQEAIDVAISRLLAEYRVEKAIKALHQAKRA